MYAPNIEHVTDAVQDVAHKVAERAPDLATAVGRGARSTADSVSDAVVKLAQKTPFVDAPKPQRGRWMLRAALIAAVAGVAMWFVNKRRSTRPWYDEVDEQAPAPDSGRASETSYATAAGR